MAVIPTAVNHDVAKYVVGAALGASAFVRPCGPTTACTSAWWKYCGGGLDHTSVYVTSHKRVSPASPFGIFRTRACAAPAAVAMQALEIRVPTSAAPPSPPPPPYSPAPVAYRILHEWNQTCGDLGYRRMDVAECDEFTVQLGAWMRQYDHDGDGYNTNAANRYIDHRYPCGCILPIGGDGGFAHEMYGLEQRGIMSLRANLVDYNNYCPQTTLPYDTTSYDFPPISDNVNHNGYRRVCPIDDQTGIDASMWIVTPLQRGHIYCDHTTHVDPLTLGDAD